jgi:hypothetical protein
VREVYPQKQEGIDSQLKETKRENKIEIDLWQNFELSKNQRFEAKKQRFDPHPSNLSHVLHHLAVGIISAKI